METVQQNGRFTLTSNFRFNIYSILFAVSSLFLSLKNFVRGKIKVILIITVVLVEVNISIYCLAPI